MPKESLTIEHLKTMYHQLDGEDISSYYERLHYHARKLKLVQIRAALDVVDDYFDPTLNHIKNIIKDLADLVEDLI